MIFFLKNGHYKINKKTYLKGLKNNLVLFNIILILLYL